MNVEQRKKWYTAPALGENENNTT